MAPSAIAVRLFLTCWLVYSVHVATNTVREIYLTLAIADHFSFRVDEYANMHPDLFEKPGYGWHIGNNPGASMLAAVPYAIAKPAIDLLVARVNQQRSAAGAAEPPSYHSPWPMARDFYREAWRRGYDVKFGLASLVTQTLCMAPISAASVALMFLLLRRLLPAEPPALWLSLLYAFGTPVFFRTGYLNQNMLLGHIAFAGFLILWNPWELDWSAERRYLLAGLAGGAALLTDYSGGVLLAALFLYGLARSRDLKLAGILAAGAAPPVFLLWWYQWRSFGHPFLPGQHWMPPVEWIDHGYQGVAGPQLDLALALAFDYRFGLFLSCPLLLAAFARSRRLPALERRFVLLLFGAFFLFFSSVHYTRLQYNTGIRYLAPMVPFLFVPAALAISRLSALSIYLVAAFSATQAWCMAMYRDVERGRGLLEPILHVFLGGLQLPALTVLSRMDAVRGEYLPSGASPLPVFLVTAVLLFAIWRKW